jgi:MYXO-CTERM domain-containing protein
MFAKLKIFVAAVGLFFLAAASAQAALVFAPLTDLGLSPGDTYRYAFVTSTTRDATSTDIADYNAFVQTVGDATGSLFAGSSIAWSAIFSTDSIAAKDNIGGVFSEPIYSVDGQLIASSSSDLWDGTLQTAINWTENHISLTTADVWTSSNWDGTYQPREDYVVYQRIASGTTQFTTGAWIAYGGALTILQRNLYAISETLTVPRADAPVPPTTALLALGLLAAAGLRRRGRH